jgi:hypothetical protein
VEVALKFAGQGKIISTRLGERVLYTLNDDRVMFLDLVVAHKVTELGVNVREKFFICKPSGAKKGADWTVWLSPEAEIARATARAGQLHAREEGTPLRQLLQESIKFVKQGKLEEIGNGAFVFQDGASLAAPDSVAADALNGHTAAQKENASLKRRNGRGNVSFR